LRPGHKSRRDILALIDGSGVEFIGEIDEREKTQFFGEAAALLFPVDWPEPFGVVMIRLDWRRAESGGNWYYSAMNVDVLVLKYLSGDGRRCSKILAALTLPMQPWSRLLRCALPEASVSVPTGRRCKGSELP
jgi:hypothetical protein